MNIEKKLIKYNFSSRNGQKISYIVIHDTGNKNKGADAEAHYKYFSGGNRNASAHYFVDDKKVIQIIEDSNASWHCGDGRGKFGITNQNSIGIEICVNVDGNYEKAFKNAIELTKELMKKYNIPTERIVRHYDASRKLCPASMSIGNWAKWSEFKKLLVPPVPQPTPSNLYRVRLSWEDAKSQKGAFSNLNYAIKCAKENSGYKVYDSNGKQVYPEVVPPIIPNWGLLKRGSVGQQVKELQAQLNKFGYKLVVDGIFGSKTETAVKDFQAKKKLSVDGIVGNNTRKALFS